ncbi:cation-translocating P-type ATPase [Candidatus Bathyarchaeota archaeon]|nr:cation-translocating P-type ATPase [Candidatus Bathyarchaeota archaeon]
MNIINEIEATLHCATAEIKTVMITGDHKLTATAIAEEIGNAQKRDLTLTGEELKEMDDSRFEEIVYRVSVYARVSTAHKQKIMKALKARGHIVAMTGDGVNDAPAVKNADIGISMGITGTNVTKEVSHMILADDNFATIVGAVEQGRIIFDNIRKYTCFLIAANFDELFLLSIFFFVGLPIPLLPAMILWINLVTDGGPAIALSVDPVEEDVMNRPPRNPKEGILHGMLSYILTSFFVMTIGSIIIFLLETWPYISTGLQIPDEVLSKARTAVFIQSVFFELFIVWNCRSEKHGVWRMNPFKNKYLLLSVLFTFLSEEIHRYIFCNFDWIPAE